MPSATSLAAALAFLAAGALAAGAARVIVGEVEARSTEAVKVELAGDHPWASVLADGLQVVIEGEAPSESARFGAMSDAGSVVDASRVIDDMSVTPTAGLAPPDFAIEILRNDAGVSLVGLIPAATDRVRLAADIAEAAQGQEVADLLQVADYPVPEGWDAALAYALDSLAGLPRSKVSVTAGRVEIDAISDSPEDQARLQTALVRDKPDGVRLAMSVSAPRPVVTPFTFRARREGGRLAFDACVADTEAALRAITEAAVAAGAEGPIDCALALGSPSPDWGAAVAAGLASLAQLDAGTLAVSDADFALVAGPATDAALFERVAGELEGALPAVFSLKAERQAAPDAAARPEGPPEFRATLSAEGLARLEGRLPDQRILDTARTYAEARFGTARVTMAARAAPEGLPEGWSMRVLAGIAALDRLGEGEVRVTPALISISGRAGSRTARQEIAADLLAALGPDVEVGIDVAYDEALDPTAGLPTPEECLAQIEAATEATRLTFDPGSATLSAAARPVVEGIAQILKGCGEVRLKVSGFTDSQGREGSNLELSQARAEAVLAALQAARVATLGFEAEGFGEADPIADNDTEQGRDANRRIEFALIADPAAAGPPGEMQGPPAPGGPEDATPGAAQGGGASADEAVGGASADEAVDAAASDG